MLSIFARCWIIRSIIINFMFISFKIDAIFQTVMVPLPSNYRCYGSVWSRTMTMDASLDLPFCLIALPTWEGQCVICMLLLVKPPRKKPMKLHPADSVEFDYDYILIKKLPSRITANANKIVDLLNSWNRHDECQDFLHVARNTIQIQFSIALADSTGFVLLFKWKFLAVIKIHSWHDSALQCDTFHKTNRRNEQRQSTPKQNQCQQYVTLSINLKARRFFGENSKPWATTYL